MMNELMNRLRRRCALIVTMIPPFMLPMIYVSIGEFVALMIVYQLTPPRWERALFIVLGMVSGYVEYLYQEQRNRDTMRYD
jgi:hypothetical protein